MYYYEAFREYLKQKRMLIGELKARVIEGGKGEHAELQDRMAVEADHVA